MSRQSDLNRTKRAQSLRKGEGVQQLRELGRGLGLASPRGEVAVRQLVQQVIKYLMEIIEALLQEENSANYRSFMAASQAMNCQLQRKMQSTLAEKLYEVRCEFLERVEDLEKQVRRTQGQRLQDNGLRQERKMITQNILQRSGSFNSFQSPRSQERFCSAQELPQVAEGEEVGSIELQSIQSKLSALEEAQGGRLRQAIEKLQRKFEENCRDIKGLTQKHVDFKMNFEEKLNLNLESLWNIISDSQTKIYEIQRHLKLN